MVDNIKTDMKVGDKVLVMEESNYFPNSKHEWKGVVINANQTFVEVEWSRDYNCEWLRDLEKELLKNNVLSNHNRIYSTNRQKFYLHPSGTINKYVRHFYNTKT